MTAETITIVTGKDPEGKPIVQTVELANAEVLIPPDLVGGNTGITQGMLGQVETN